VEIGAGEGALTRMLARRAARVVALEVHPVCASTLRAAFRDQPTVEVVERDFLLWPLPADRYKVFANPPFALTSAIVRRLTDDDRPPEEAWLVLEDAAARRYAGWPFGVETLRSLLLKPEWHLELRAELGAHEFTPPARGPCALLRIARREPALVEPERRALYRDFVSFAFGRQGNRVDQCLRGALTREQLRRCARSLRFAPLDAPSSLGFEQWLGLFRCFDEWASKEARARVRGARTRLPR
jgi:23S rRNA (adenine-N6)-dimethyltransferase